MKKEEVVYKAISEILEVSVERLKKTKNLSEIELWDSLNQLNILIKLDTMFKNKVSSITKMAKADSVKKIIKLLRDNKLI